MTRRDNLKNYFLKKPTSRKMRTPKMIIPV